MSGRINGSSRYSHGPKKGQLNRRNPLTEYWVPQEIWMHDKKSVFPDWGEIGLRYMELKRTDYRLAYRRRKKALLKYKKEYRQRTDVKAAHAARQREKCQTDPGFRVRKRLSKRLSELIGGMGGGSILQYVGCTQDELRCHIESQFKRGMTWENYGTHWHIDHIIPCAAFDHTDRNQVLQCWHWSNLRPLEAKKNIAKRDKITHPQLHLRLERCA